MAYGLIYNLNFSSSLDGNRKNRLSIYKDGHTATITTSDNNIIGTNEPVILVWDNSDDIYNNIMGSRLEMNFYSDDVKQIDVEDILDNTSPAKYKVEFYVENASQTMVKYWEGYLSNATYQENISSTPQTYQLIATDLLGTIKNIFTTDGSALIQSKKTVAKYLENVLAFLPQNYGLKISNDIQIKPFKFGQTNNFTKMHLLQWLLPYKDGYDMLADTVDDYIVNTLKAFNSRLFYSNDNWYIINNSSYQDTAEFDNFDTSGEYVNTTSSSIKKTIPTDLKPIGNDLSIRYDTPIDTIEVKIARNHYATDFYDIGLSDAEIDNLTPYGSFETKPNGILFNSTYYSDNQSVVLNLLPIVKKGNFSVATLNYITSGSPTQKILDTGFQGDFQWDAAGDTTFFTSYYIRFSGQETENFTLNYSLLRELSSTSNGLNPTRSYYNGSSWVGYTNESNATKLTLNDVSAPSQWNEISETINTSATSQYARYRIILWQPKINTIDLDLQIYLDEVVLSRRNQIKSEDTVRTVSRISGSTRRNKKLTYEFQNFYPVTYGTEAKSDNITFTGILGYTQLNRLISQQILNDNRKHIKRYSISVVPDSFDDILYPYNKLDINFTGFTTGESCIIDRMRYKAKSGVYELEFHETNQSTNVTLSTTVT